MRQVLANTHDAVTRHFDHALVDALLDGVARNDVVHATILDVAGERLDGRVNASGDSCNASVTDSTPHSPCLTLPSISNIMASQDGSNSTEQESAQATVQHHIQITGSPVARNDGGMLSRRWIQWCVHDLPTTSPLRSWRVGSLPEKWLMTFSNATLSVPGVDHIVIWTCSSSSKRSRASTDDRL